MSAGYSDDTLKFCRNDGTALVSGWSALGESGQTLILPSKNTGEAAQTQTTGPTGAVNSRTQKVLIAELVV